jgi:hypothetical protein
MRREHRFWGIVVILIVLLAGLTTITGCVGGMIETTPVVGNIFTRTHPYCRYYLNCGDCFFTDSCGKFNPGDTIRYVKR